MQSRPINRNVYYILIGDVLLIAFSLIAAHLVRFEFTIPPEHWPTILWALPIALIVKLATFYFFDLYRGMWRYTSIQDLFNIIKAGSTATLLILCFILIRYQFIGFSRSVFLIDWCLTVLFIGGFRLGVRRQY